MTFTIPEPCVGYLLWTVYGIITLVVTVMLARKAYRDLVYKPATPDFGDQAMCLFLAVMIGWAWPVYPLLALGYFGVELARRVVFYKV